MVDRIDGTNSLKPNRRPEQERGSAAVGGAAGKLGGNRPNQPDTPLLEGTRLAVANSDGIDRQKVDAIKTAIRNGEFQIDAKAVARAFVDLEVMTGR